MSKDKTDTALIVGVCEHGNVWGAQQLNTSPTVIGQHVKDWHNEGLTVKIFEGGCTVGPCPKCPKRTPTLLEAAESAYHTLGFAILCGLDGFTDEQAARTIQDHGTLKQLRSAIVKAGGFPPPINIAEGNINRP